MTPQQRADLEEERDFLLRSLDDLERERAAGDVEPEDYESLKDSYTSRAADVLRRLSAPDAPVATPRRRNRAALVAWVAGIVAVAVLAGWLVARSSGERRPGQVASGNIESDSVSGLLAQARGQLNPVEPGPAIDLYGQVLELEPDNVEALTYLGWLSVLSSGQATDVDEAGRLFETGLILLRQATTVDDTYADPHCFLGIAFSRIDDPEAAESEFERCLDLDPPAEVRGMVESALERVQSELDQSADTSAPDASAPDTSIP